MSTPTLEVNLNDVTTPLSEFFIGKKLANERIHRYQNGKRELLTKEMANKQFLQGESKYVWYPKEYFEVMLNEMNLYNANGIRIYFGEYEGKPGTPPAGQLGLIFVLTEKTEENTTKDILLESKPGYEQRFNAAKEMGINLHVTEDSIEREFNVCGPCPPGCDNQETLFPDNDLLNA